MDIFQEVINCLENKKKTKGKNYNNHILAFDDLQIEEYINRGQQGLVLKVSNGIKRYFALKFYRPSDQSEAILKESLNNFRKEVRILASLSHKNIVKIFSGGYAVWEPSNKLWKIDSGFDSRNSLKENEVAYYLMDYIQGEDLSSLFPELSTDNNKKIHSNLSLEKKVELFEDLVTQISYAIHYYHEKRFTHKDIKPQNIRYSQEDSNFILVDFGFAHSLASKPDSETMTRTKYFDQVSVIKQDYLKNDMGQFCRMLLDLLPTIEPAYDSNRYQGLINAVQRGCNDDLNKRYYNMMGFYNGIKQYFLLESGWKFELKIDEYLTPSHFGRFHSKLRIPVSGSIILSKEIKNIIDTPEFQRLRGVRQLGPSIFVFPGANHTRFEHSLGAYHLSLRYLDKLIGIPYFREKIEPLDDSIKLIVLSALLHDIGHYPYSHWIEEIKEFPNGIKIPSHEERAKTIIKSSNIGKEIENIWEVDINKLANIIAARHLNEKDVLINSFINSMIDVDKMDYLIRDSIHCGVDYGHGIDMERFLDSLFLDSSGNKICVSDKGKSSLLSILTCRNIMYQEVYWHKTVRACDAMFKRFFYEYIAKERIKDSDIISMLALSDDEFIYKLYTSSLSSHSRCTNLIEPFAFRGRAKLFKPAYIHLLNSPSERNDTRDFFSKLSTLSYPKLIEINNQLAKILAESIKGLTTLDIILEITPIRPGHELSEILGFKVWNARKKEYEDYPHEIELMANYLEKNKRAYLFCNPKYYEALKEFSKKGNLDRVFGELK